MNERAKVFADKLEYFTGRETTAPSQDRREFCAWMATQPEFQQRPQTLTRERIEEALGELGVQMLNCGHPRLSADLFAKLSAPQNESWIACSEKLPVNGQDIDIAGTYDDGEPFGDVGHRSADKKWYTPMGAIESNGKGCSAGRIVTHWRPRAKPVPPEPAKKDSLQLAALKDELRPYEKRMSELNQRIGCSSADCERIEVNTTVKALKTAIAIIEQCEKAQREEPRS